jgi:hypothetical protein
VVISVDGTEIPTEIVSGTKNMESKRFVDFSVELGLDSASRLGCFILFYAKDWETSLDPVEQSHMPHDRR